MSNDRDIKLQRPGVSFYDHMSDAELIKALENKIKEIRETYLNDNLLKQSSLNSEYKRYSAAHLEDICKRLEKHPEFKEIIDSVLEFDKQVSDFTLGKESTNVIKQLDDLQRFALELEENVKKMKLGEKAEAPTRRESKRLSQPRPTSTYTTATETRSETELTTSTATSAPLTTKTKALPRTKPDKKSMAPYKQHIKELKSALKKYREAAKKDEKGVYTTKRQDTKVVMGFHAPYIEDLIGQISEDLKTTKGLTAKDDEEFLSLVKESNVAILHLKYRSLREKLKKDAKELAGSMQEKSKEKTGYRIVIEKLKTFRSEAEDAIAIKRALDSISPGLVKDDPNDTEEFKKRVTSRLRELEEAQAVFDQRAQMLSDWVKKSDALFSGMGDDDPLKKLYTHNFERLYLVDVQGFMPPGITAEELSERNVSHTLSMIDADFDLALNYFKAAKSATQLRMEHQVSISLKREDLRHDIAHPQLQLDFDAYFKKLNLQLEVSDPTTLLSKPKVKLTTEGLKSFESSHKRKYEEVEKKADTALLCFKQADDLLKAISELQRQTQSAIKTTLDDTHSNTLQFFLDKLNAREKEILTLMQPGTFQPSVVKSKLEEMVDEHTLDKMALQKEELRSRIKAKHERLTIYLKEDEDLKNTFSELHLKFYLNVDALLTPEVILDYMRQPGGSAGFEKKLDEIEQDVDKAIQLFEATAAINKTKGEAQARLQKREQSQTGTLSHPDLIAIQANRFVRLHQELAQMDPILELTQIGPHFSSVSPQRFSDAFIAGYVKFESKLDLERQCFELADKLLSEQASLKAELEKAAASHDKEGKYKTAYDIVMGGLEGQTETLLALMQIEPMNVMEVHKALSRMGSSISRTKENFHANLIWVIENAQQELKSLLDILKTESPDDPAIAPLLKKLKALQDQPINMLKEAKVLKENILKLKENVIGVVLNNAISRMQEFEKYLKANKHVQWEGEQHLTEFEKLYDRDKKQMQEDLKKLIAKSKNPELVRKQKELQGMLDMLDSLIDRKKLHATHDEKTTSVKPKESLTELQQTRSTYKQPAASVEPKMATQRSLPPIPPMFKRKNLDTFLIDLGKLIDTANLLFQSLKDLKAGKVESSVVEQKISKVIDQLAHLARSKTNVEKHIDVPDQFIEVGQAPALLMALSKDVQDNDIEKISSRHYPALKNLLIALEVIEAHAKHEPEEPTPTSQLKRER